MAEVGSGQGRYTNMTYRDTDVKGLITRITACITLAALCWSLGGCGQGGLAGYTNDWPYPRDISTVYVEMFDSLSFRRGYEYTLTDAICKRIEAQTPYKIVSDRDFADSVLSGQITGIGSGVLALDRDTGLPLEQEVQFYVTVSWKNLKTGELLINSETVTASSSYSTELGQTFDYSAAVAANRAAQRVVELMEVTW
jgi:hypothetical protein